jgi:beta-keto acid cleavage enzyme
MADPILIIAALNGSRDRKIAKKLPYTPAEIAKEAKRAVDAGAGVVHVHARRDDGGSAFDLTFDEIVTAIRAQVDVPISITTQRTRQTSLGTITALFDVLRELPELATVNVQPPAPDLPAHREEARQILEACERAGVAPEPGINSFEAIADVEALYEDGLLAQAPWLNLELGGAAGTSEQGLAGTPRNLLRLVDALDGTHGHGRCVRDGCRARRPPARRPRGLPAASGRHAGNLQRRARRACRRACRRTRPRADGARRGAPPPAGLSRCPRCA